jgi:hypothetical protein
MHFSVRCVRIGTPLSARTSAMPFAGGSWPLLDSGESTGAFWCALAICGITQILRLILGEAFCGTSSLLASRQPDISTSDQSRSQVTSSGWLPWQAVPFPDRPVVKPAPSAVLLKSASSFFECQSFIPNLAANSNMPESSMES